VKTSLNFPTVAGAFLLSTLFASGARPQSGLPASTAEKSNSASVVVILAGRLIDVRTGHVTSNAYIVVEKDRIGRIVTAAPAGIKVIDLSKFTVVPGLIDCHAHLLGNPKDQSAMSGLRMSSGQAAIWGVHNVTIWLDHGFTALRDAGESDIGYGQLALRNSIERGLIRGPRMVSAGNFVAYWRPWRCRPTRSR
jgi:imidazolonepropionase-like amidohydrolase